MAIDFTSATHSCTPFDWSPIGAASSQSAIAALFAGFVFTGIIVILTVQSHSHRREAAQALKLLLTAFFGLAVNAYLLADMAGEHTCLRAQTTEVLAGGSLGAFAVMMVIFLTWLVAAYNRKDSEVLKLLHGLVYISCVFVALLLCSSSVIYIDAEIPKSANSAAHASAICIVVASLIGIGVFRVVRPPRRLSPAAAKRGDVATTSAFAVQLSVWIALGNLTISSIATGIALSVPAADWYPSPPHWVAYITGILSILLPLAMLAAGVNAMAEIEAPSKRPELS